MSEENVETAREVLEAVRESFERGDPGAWMESDAVSDDFEWVLETGVTLETRTVWSGREGLIEFFHTWMSQFDEYSIRLERLIDVGDNRVVSIVHQRGVGKESGVPVEWHIGQVLEFEDGRLIRSRNYATPADALEAAGLSE